MAKLSTLTVGGLTVIYLIVISSLNYFRPEPVAPVVADPSPIVIEQHQSTQFQATGYAIGHPYNTIAKLGSPVINRGFLHVGGIDIFTIAVDPEIIPLGSLVYIDSLGLAMATDTGRKIKGKLIDICFTNIDDAMEWGRKDIKVYMIRRAE